jgi:hypothetical protein
MISNFVGAGAVTRPYSRFLDFLEGNPTNVIQRHTGKRQRESKLCVVCLEDCDADTFPEMSLSGSCNHKVDACTKCVAAHINSQINESPARISCTSCLEPLGFDAVKLYASAEAFDRYLHPKLTLLVNSRCTDLQSRYDRFFVMETFKDDPSFAMCLRPSCDSGQLHTGGDGEPIMTCNTCHFKTCFVHKLPWHSGNTCAEYDTDRKEKLEQEAATKEFLKKETKVCPNPKCGLNVVKISGCDHMTCKFYESNVL